MVSEMENEHVEEMEVEVLSSMWPEDINEAGKQFNIEKPGADQDMLEEVNIIEEPTIVDFKRLVELTNYSEKGSSQLAYLINNWEYKQANVARLLREELDNLSRQQHAVELKKLEILEEHRFVDESYGGDKRPISILEAVIDIWQDAPKKRSDVVVQDRRVEIDAEYDTVKYWKQRAVNLEILLEASFQREQILLEKLQESIENLERQSSPVEELSQVLKRADNFLHFVLQNAPVVIGHQDKELRYRFIYNHFPRLREEDIIGKTDVEIFTGGGVKESQDFKREVLERGLPAKREITFETELFGSKTFLIYVEPVFSKSGETIGVNYMGMEVTDQVRKREKMAKLREEIAVQKAKETELNKTIHITEETMRAKQMLATMSHEIRSPLSGVVSMAEILSTTQLDKEQRQLIRVMLSSGDLVLQLINDILDLSKVESGVMKLEATKFRPREVVKHVLQTSAASLQKMLILEGDIADDVPIEVIGDVLRIRQILTNLISNAVKFTHEGKVGIKLYVVTQPCPDNQGNQNINFDQSPVSASKQKEDKSLGSKQIISDRKRLYEQANGEGPYRDQGINDEREMKVEVGYQIDGENMNEPHSHETKVWIRCDVHDTGIGIPETALPNLFKKYMQAGADTARKYGGTGLGLAICKQLVELMGGHLTVSSKENIGSTFTFVLPYKVSPICDSSDDPDELTGMAGYEASEDDATSGFFQFQPRFNGCVRTKKSAATAFESSAITRIDGLSVNSSSFAVNEVTSREANAEDDACSVADPAETSLEPETYLLCKPESGNINGNENDQHINHDESLRHQNYCSEINHSSEIRKDAGQSTEARMHETHETQVKTDSGSECSTSNNMEVCKPTAKPNILLVEDNKVNIIVARSMMKQLGHDIHVVNNGAEAIRAVQRGSYNLILMDVCMPVMDGLRATRLIRSFEETGNWDEATKAGVEQYVSPSNSTSNGQETKQRSMRIPIIAMTANTMSESAEECFANGMDSFVSKPLTFQNLKQCLEQYLPR